MKWNLSFLVEKKETMKTIIIILLLFGSTRLFAGNGVVVGDGYPLDLAKQERMDSTTVDQEFANFVENVAMFSPEIAYLLNVGLSAIQNKKITLVKIQDFSHEHFAFIEDAKIVKQNGGLVLSSVPSIYFYENYFLLNNDIKLKILVHEFMHMYLGTSELKVQRVTDLLFKLSKGDFSEADYKSLALELSVNLEGLDIYKNDGNGLRFNCERAVGLKYIPIYKMPKTFDQVAYLAVPTNEVLDNFNAMTFYAKNVFVTNGRKIFGNKIFIGSDRKSECTSNDLNKLNLDVIDFKGFINHTLNSMYNGPTVLLTEEQLNEALQYQVPPEKVDFRFLFDKIGFSNKYDVLPTAYSAEVTLKTPLKSLTQVSLRSLDFIDNLKVLYGTYKKLFTILGQGSETTVSPYGNDFVLYGVDLKIRQGTTSAASAGISCIDCNEDIFANAKYGTVEVTSNEVIYHSTKMKIRANSIPLQPVKTRITFRTEWEFVE